jgi:hypothetical protein
MFHLIPLKPSFIAPEMTVCLVYNGMQFAQSMFQLIANGSNYVMFFSTKNNEPCNLHEQTFA